jgi:hypothetical protein
VPAKVGADHAGEDGVRDRVGGTGFLPGCGFAHGAEVVMVVRDTAWVGGCQTFPGGGVRLGEDLGIGGARFDDGHRDVPGSKFQPQRVRQGRQGRLAGRQGGQERHRNPGRHRADVDHPAVAHRTYTTTPTAYLV